MTRISSRSPDDDDHSSAQISRRDEPGFAVLETLVRENGMAIGENELGIGEIEPTLSQRPFALGR